MTELYPPDEQINDLSGTTDPQQEVLYIPAGESPYYTSFYKMLYRLLRVVARAGDLRVYKDGDLTFGVRAGRFDDGQAAVEYAGTQGVALADDATNYIFLDATGVLQANTAAFPATPHLPLAVINVGSASAAAVSGEYSHDDITDYRGRAMFRPAGGLTISAGSEASDARTITITGGPWRQRMRIWIAESDYGAPSATGNTVAISTGTQLREITADADYEVISDADGEVAIGVTISGAASRYVMVEVDGRIHSSGEITWAA